MSQVLETGEQIPDCEVDLTHVSARGHSLSPFVVMYRYSQGIFPWLKRNDHNLWWSPEPRCVIRTKHVHVSRSLKKTLRRGTYKVTADTRFDQVLHYCRHTPRRGNAIADSWIDLDVQNLYSKLHGMGHAHSIEVWQNGAVVGGLFGLAVGQAFFGASMFYHSPNASKVGFAHLCYLLASWGWPLIDCQIGNRYLKSLGSEWVDRRNFTQVIEKLSCKKPMLGPWTAAMEEFTKKHTW
jgi:leucyl/phenylalanyl-tRNA--protein transferase